MTYDFERTLIARLRENLLRRDPCTFISDWMVTGLSASTPLTDGGTQTVTTPPKGTHLSESTI